VLEHHAERAALRGRHYLAALERSCQKNYSGGQALSNHSGEDLEPIQDRHGHVDDRDIGSKMANGPKALLTVGATREKRTIRITGNEVRQAFENHGMIVSDDDAYGMFAGHHG